MAGLAGLAPKHPPARAPERLLRILLVATLLVPALLFGGFAWHLHATHLAQARAKLEHTLDLLHEHAVKVFETHDLVAAQVDQLLYGLPDAEVRAHEQELHNRLRAITRRLEQVQDVWVVARDGRPLVGANVYPFAPGLDLSDREYFRVHRDGRIGPRAAYVSDVLRGRAVDGSPLQLFSKRRGAYEAGGLLQDFSGVVAISVNTEYFERFYAQVAADGPSMVALSRADGTALARYPPVRNGTAPQATLPAQPSGLAAATAASPERGSFEQPSPIDGTTRLVAYRRLPDYPLYVTAGADRGTIVAGWLRDLGTHLLFAVPAVIGLFLLTLLALRRTRSAASATARFRAEAARREETEQRLVQAQRMEAVGQLTAGVAHDFNNLLQAQMAGLELLLEECAGQERARLLIERAIAAGERGAKLTHHLLAFSRKQVLQPWAIDLPGLLEDLGHVLGRTLGPQVELRIAATAGIARPYADGAQLEAALLNLCLNARDAMPGGGSLRIEAFEAEAPSLASPEGLRPGRYVILSVSDTGAGMDPETLARACEPFFTTKGVGKGSGLGLSMVQGFARQSNGELRVRSQPGQGTRIELWLPGAETGAAPGGMVAAERPGPRRQGAGRVLLVDDAPEVLDLVSEMLEAAGFVVTTAASGEAALALLDDAAAAATPAPSGSNGGFDALVTDYAMPGMDGAALIRRARRLLPHLPALVITGYAEGEELRDMPHGVRVVHKPFRVDALASEIGAAIAAVPRLAA